MSTAQRFAWLDGLSTVAVCGLAIAVLPPEAPASAWGMAARIAAVTLVCIVAFYYNDLYNFEVPHDVGQLFVRLCRALGLSALVLAGGYLMFPGMILGGNLASYALLLTLLCVLALRVVVYALAKRAPFSEAVLLLGGGPLAVDLARQIRTRPDLALRLVGVLNPAGADGEGDRLGDYGDVGAVVRRVRPHPSRGGVPGRPGDPPGAPLPGRRLP